MKKKILFAMLLCGMLLAVLSTAALARDFICKNCKTDNTAFLEYRNANDGTGKHYAWYKCNNCGETMRDEASGSYHSGGTATCTHGKYCEFCGTEYGLFGHTLRQGDRPTCQKRLVCAVCHEEFGKLGDHEIRTVPEKPATCQQEGHTKYSYCTVPGCGYKDGYQTLPKTDHQLKQAREFTREPTCLKKGWKSYYLCKDCSYSTTDWLDALGHDPISHTAQAPTCTKDGWAEYETCSRCNYSTYQAIPALKHDLKHHEAKAATCTEKGWEAYDTCKNCNYTTYAEIPAPGHDLEHHEAKAATCTEKGWEAYDTCKNCSYTTYQEIPALDHDWDNWTHNGDRTHTRTCKRDASHSETGNCSVFFEANCISPSRCKVCWGTYGEINPDNHQWLNNWRSNGDGTHYSTCNHNVFHVRTENCTGGDATCTREGKCSVCNAMYKVPHKDDDKNHLCDACNEKLSEHSFTAESTDARYLKSKATCTSPAVYYKSCALCGEKGTETFETEKNPDNHDLVHHDAKAATCTEIGWDEYDTCKRCNYTTYKEKPIDPDNHDLVHHDAKAATCTEIGWDEYDTCTRCDYTTYVELPVLGHDYQKTVVKPTCEKGGYTRYTCSRCEDTYTENPVKKLLHWYGEWTPNGDGTHSADCRRNGCKHTGKTDCQKFEFQVEENESLLFCPVCGNVKNGERLELIEKALATAVTGKLPAGEVVVRMNDAYLSIAFEYAGKLTAPTGQVKITLPVELLEGKTLTLFALDGSEMEIPFEIDGEEISFTLDFTDAEIPVMLIRTNPEA